MKYLKTEICRCEINTANEKLKTPNQYEQKPPERCKMTEIRKEIIEKVKFILELKTTLQIARARKH